MAYNYINTTGTVVADTSDTLLEVQNEYKAILGADLNVSPETPQGGLIAAETISRQGTMRNNAQLANQINPNFAGGVFLDALCALTALERTQATRTEVTGNITGVAGTIIPQGSQVRTTSGDYFYLQNSAVIGAGGTVDAVFLSSEKGEIPAESGTLTQIVDGVIGWEGITNATSGTLGTNTQSDYSLRTQRKETLFLQSVGLIGAIVSGLKTVEGVKSLSFYENYTDAEVTIDTIAIAAHSVYSCVDGGSDEDVAQMLLSKKSCGCGYVGDETVVVLEPSSTQLYTIKFSRPTEVPILVRTTVTAPNPLVDVIGTVKDAMVNYANGDVEGEKGFEVNRDVSAFELGGAVNITNSGIFVKSVEVSDDDGMTWTAGTISILLSQVARLSADDIDVTVV